MGHTHLIVGAGRMGGAMIKGWTSGRKPVVRPAQIAILDPHPGLDAQAAIDAGAAHMTTITSDMAELEHLILAVKPQLFDAVVPSLADYIPETCLVTSIMAGVSLQRLGTAFPNRPLVRAMPNTPAAIGAGMTAFTITEAVSKAQTKAVKKLLSAAGKVEQVANEAMIDMVTAVSGSGPAYVFYLTEALEAAAVDIGMPTDLAPIFARETIIGAAALLKTSDEPADALRVAVTSPGGTTQAALDVLMSENGLAPLMKAAVRAALKRAKDLS